MYSSRYLEEIAESFSPSTSAYTRVNCPACEDRGKDTADNSRSLSINNENGFFKCWRCELKGKLFDNEDEEIEDENEEWEDVPLEMPSDFRAIESSDEGLNYMLGRGFDQETMRRAGVGFACWGKHAGRVILPFRGITGELVGWVGRTTRDANPRYWTAQGMDRSRIFYNDSEVYKKRETPLIVTEGPLDALKWWPHAVAALGKPTSEQKEKLAKHARPMLIILDGDAWREGLSIARELRRKGAEAYAIALEPGKDLAETKKDTIRKAAKFAFEHKIDTDTREQK